jgi:hypothetical protein
MLNHLRKHVTAVFEPVQVATLATTGPAGLLANVFPCRAVGLRLYFRVPRTSDHLVNLEADPAAVATTSRWQARGCGHVVALTDRPPELVFPGTEEMQWYDVVEFVPARVDISQPTGWGNVETIDIG